MADRYYLVEIKENPTPSAVLQYPFQMKSLQGERFFIKEDFFSNAAVLEDWISSRISDYNNRTIKYHGWAWAKEWVEVVEEVLLRNTQNIVHIGDAIKVVIPIDEYFI